MQCNVCKDFIWNDKQVKRGLKSGTLGSSLDKVLILSLSIKEEIIARICLMLQILYVKTDYQIIKCFKKLLGLFSPYKAKCPVLL